MKINFKHFNKTLDIFKYLHRRLPQDVKPFDNYQVLLDKIIDKERLIEKIREQEMKDLHENLRYKILNANRFNCVVNLEQTIDRLLQTYRPTTYTQLINLLITNKNNKWY